MLQLRRRRRRFLLLHNIIRIRDITDRPLHYRDRFTDIFLQVFREIYYQRFVGKFYARLQSLLRDKSDTKRCILRMYGADIRTGRLDELCRNDTARFSISYRDQKV